MSSAVVSHDVLAREDAPVRREMLSILEPWDHDHPYDTLGRSSSGRRRRRRRRTDGGREGW